MVDKKILTRGGIYLAKLDPAKAAEVGKIRPVIVLNSQVILDVLPPIAFICPLSSQSKPEFASLHIEIPARDGLQVVSYALVEHCRSVSTQRLMQPRIAQTTDLEITRIIHWLNRFLGV